MSIIKVDYGEVGGGTELELFNDNIQGSSSKTFHTKNAYGYIQSPDIILAEVKDGIFRLIKNAYPASVGASYNTSTNELTLSILDGSARNGYCVYEKID